MHAVVNHIPIAEGADWAEMIGLAEGFAATTCADHPEVVSMQAVRAGDAEMILIIQFSDEASMAEFSSKIAGPWFAENIRKFMGGPADRKTGEVVLDYRA